MSFLGDLELQTDIAFFTLPDGNIAHVEFNTMEYAHGVSRDHIMKECIESAAPNSEIRIISTKDYSNNGEGDRYSEMYPNKFTILDNKTINHKDYFPTFWDKFDKAYDIREQKQIVSDFISKYS